MSTRKCEIKFRCDNDCLQSGCPGHTMKACLQDTSDWLSIKDEKEKVIYSGDIAQTRTLLKAIEQLDYGRFYFGDLLEGFSDKKS